MQFSCNPARGCRLLLYWGSRQGHKRPSQATRVCLMNGSEYIWQLTVWQ